MKRTARRILAGLLCAGLAITSPGLGVYRACAAFSPYSQGGRASGSSIPVVQSDKSGAGSLNSALGDVELVAPIESPAPPKFAARETGAAVQAFEQKAPDVFGVEQRLVEQRMGRPLPVRTEQAGNEESAVTGQAAQVAGQLADNGGIREILSGDQEQGLRSVMDGETARDAVGAEPLVRAEAPPAARRPWFFRRAAAISTSIGLLGTKAALGNPDGKASPSNDHSTLLALGAAAVISLSAAAYFGPRLIRSIKPAAAAVRSAFSDRYVYWKAEAEKWVQRRQLGRFAASEERTFVYDLSMTLPEDNLKKIEGISDYEARGLSNVFTAMDPNVNVIFLTSTELDPIVIEQLLRNLPNPEEVRGRIEFIHVGDDRSYPPLTRKLLDRPDIVQKLRERIADLGKPATLVPFISGGENEKNAEWRLAKALGIPLSAAHPSLAALGEKSGNRDVFRKVRENELKAGFSPEAALHVADGEEDIYSVDELVEAIDKITTRNPEAEKIMVKLNSGTSGGGNAVLTLPEKDGDHERWLSELRKAFVDMQFYGGSDWKSYSAMIPEHGAIAEIFIEGLKEAPSPSGQADIIVLPNGKLEIKIASNHDQVLEDGTVYIGASQPADPNDDEGYRQRIHRHMESIAKELARRGYIGRFAVDFGWVNGTLWAIEANLRQGGTTHPWQTAVALTGAKYNPRTQRLERLTEDGRRVPVAYKSIDHERRPLLAGIPLKDIRDYFWKDGASPGFDVMFDQETKKGAVFHLLGAASRSGNVGYTIIAETPEEVREIEQRLLTHLDRLQTMYRTGARYNPHSGLLERPDPRDGNRFVPIHFRVNDHNVRPSLRVASKGTFDGFFWPGKGFVPGPRGSVGHSVLYNGTEGVIMYPEEALGKHNKFGYIVVAESEARAAEIEARFHRLLDELEVEAPAGAYLANDLAPKGALVNRRGEPEFRYRHVESDARERAYQGMTPEERSSKFREFMKRPENRGLEFYGWNGLVEFPTIATGAVFHPTGYTIVGNDDEDVERIHANMARMWERFEAQGQAARP